MSQDEEQLKLLSIFHYILGGLAGLVSLIPVFHLCLGLLMVFNPQFFGKDTPPAFLGWIIAIVAGLVIITGLTFAILVILSGRFLVQRKHHMFCMVMAGVECLFSPFGTALGVFTLIVLMRDSVKQLFIN